MNRSSGILLHISSLPGPFGVGNLGPFADQFTDFLAEAGFTVWQVLPISPVSAVFGNSPYSSQSAFAGNPLFISPEKLEREGLICEEDICRFIREPSSAADYRYATEAMSALLIKAWANFCVKNDKFLDMHKDFKKFKQNESGWLRDYALFTVLKEHFGNLCWNEWPLDFSQRNNDSLQNYISQRENADAIDFVSFIQFVFSRQWNELHERCRAKGISLLGDIPMFVALDSADVWANQDLFDLNEQGRPNCIAGVPPDYFSKTGQRWGNPLYRWDIMEADGFRWWIDRINSMLQKFDAVRVDHFRGFCGYWAIPYSEDTAQYGRWCSAPAAAFFEILKREKQVNGSRKLSLIAEDLGVITDDVRMIMDDLGLPGMKILLFAFGNNVGTNPYAPHNIVRNSVVYTGTHDNNTVYGWWNNESSESERNCFKSYIGHDVRSLDVARQMVLLALSSVAMLAIIPMQDILGLGSECRMNIPGKLGGNWEWRLTQTDFSLFCAENSLLAKELKTINSIYGRGNGEFII